MAADVVVVGTGNAGLCAALAARACGAEVVVLEKAPPTHRGGNSYYSSAVFRFVYRGMDDILALAPDLSPAELERMDVGAYSEADFFDDLMRVTDYRSDADLADVLVRESYPTMCWFRDLGLRAVPLWGVQWAQGSKHRFFPGLVLELVGGGPGLVDGLLAAAEARGVAVRYESMVVALRQDARGRVTGLRVKTAAGGVEDMAAKAVVLASGGFEANAEMRATYLGAGWDLVKVRGTRYNTGEAIRMALDIGAQPCGHWSGCHAVAWDANAPPYGDPALGDVYRRHYYPYGIIVNVDGERYVDEGADIRYYTYAKYGRQISKQPRMLAAQVFDAKIADLLPPEYRRREAARFTASTIEELADKLGIGRAALAKTVRDFNAAVQPGEFNPRVKDGKRAVGITPPKSNWALAIDTPPFLGFLVTPGITFTFGGLKTSPRGQVLDTMDQPIPGLYAAGELVGGLFYDGYPGGSGLMAGAVFGRVAGRSAGQAAKGEG
ncbi:MAG: FAD-dependent tricarballylate dehydrogenase TcuA [Chloroflexi bacterium]|nr:FAD-dependent tricarballylate dehydrogenase TcuA [Chloroflexota bacterium]